MKIFVREIGILSNQIIMTMIDWVEIPKIIVKIIV